MILWSLVFKAPRSTCFQILCYVSAKFFNIHNATKLGKTELQEYEPRRTTAILKMSKGESPEFEWNIFPGFTTLQLCDKINDLLSSLGQSPEAFTGRILFMSMFNDISCDGKGNKQQCLKDADFVKTFARRFGIGQWSFIGPGSEKKWYPSENSPQGEWDYIAEDMLLKFAESGHHPCMCTCVFRLVCFLLACLVLYFVSPFSFQPFLMFTSALNERSRSNTLCDFRLGTVVTSDHETPLTILERQPEKLHNTLINSDGVQFWHHISLHSELAHLCNWCPRVDVLHVARKRNASRTHNPLPDCVSMRVHEPRSQMAMRRVISDLRGSQGGVSDV